MLALLDFDSANCRINSIRKESFFNRVIKNSGYKYSDMTNEFRDKTQWLFSKISDDKRNELIAGKVIRPGSLNGNAETITQQYAYIKSSLQILKNQVKKKNIIK